MGKTLSKEEQRQILCSLMAANKYSGVVQALIEEDFEFDEFVAKLLFFHMGQDFYVQILSKDYPKGVVCDDTYTYIRNIVFLFNIEQKRLSPLVELCKKYPEKVALVKEYFDWASLDLAKLTKEETELLELCERWDDLIAANKFDKVPNEVLIERKLWKPLANKKNWSEKSHDKEVIMAFWENEQFDYLGYYEWFFIISEIPNGKEIAFKHCKWLELEFYCRSFAVDRDFDEFLAENKQFEALAEHGSEKRWKVLKKYGQQELIKKYKK